MSNTVKLDLIGLKSNKVEYTTKERRKWFIFPYWVGVKKHYYDIKIQAIQESDYFRVGDVILLSFDNDHQQMNVVADEDGILYLSGTRSTPLMAANYNVEACIIYRVYTEGGLKFQAIK